MALRRRTARTRIRRRTEPRRERHRALRYLRRLELPSGPEVLDKTERLHAILDGSAAQLPVPADPSSAQFLADALGADEPIDPEVALVISTSGSTGTPKGALHTAATLRASAEATAARLGGAGDWLLALAPHHIAGLQVLLRALAAGHRATVLDLRDGFDVDAFARAAPRLGGPRRYTSLVPTQLHKVLRSPAATAAARELDAILIGGAATPPSLQRKAIDAGLRIVRTYGMSETAGGCVYDGVPLAGVEVRITDATSDGVGRVELSGPMIARGYRHLRTHRAFADPGWFRTDDLGIVDDGVLAIVGRADEAISSGGLTIVPQVVEAVIADDPAVAECVVVGIPDDRLGERVVAFVVPNQNPLDANRIKGLVTERLDRYAAPREIIELPEIPRRGPGKPDRRALRDNYR